MMYSKEPEKPRGRQFTVLAIFKRSVFVDWVYMPVFEHNLDR